MLQSLISLSDSEIELVATAVWEWCRANNCDIDSTEGRRALTLAVDLAQAKNAEDGLLPELAHRLAPHTVDQTGTVA